MSSGSGPRGITGYSVDTGSVSVYNDYVITRGCAWLVGGVQGLYAHPERDKRFGVYGYHVPATNTPNYIADTPASFQNSFVGPTLGGHGRLPCLELAAELYPHSADGYSVAAIQRGEFSAARLRKALADCFDPSSEGSNGHCSPSSFTYHQSLFLFLSWNCVFSPRCHTLLPS